MSRAGAAVLNGVIHLLDGSNGKTTHTAGQLHVTGDTYALDTAHPSHMGLVRVGKSDKHLHRASMGAAVATGPCFRCEQDLCCCETHCKSRRTSCCNN